MGLQLAIIGLTLLTTVFLIFIGFKAINETSQDTNKHKAILVFSLLFWHLFILLISSTNILKSYEFPPRFAIAFIIPSFIFTGVFLYRNRSNVWIKKIPERWIVYFQSFRIIVEILFLLALKEEVFNYHVTLEGYNFDMLFAVTAPIIAYMVYTKNLLPRRVVLLWNYIGLTVLASVIFLFVTSIYRPQLYGSEIPLLPLISFSYPYVVIAGFLMPTAVFLHVFSIFQLRSD
jgi:hypothetical protein